MKARLVNAGLAVSDLGVLHTPGMYFSVFHYKADGGVMITASHNPSKTMAQDHARPQHIFGAEIRSCVSASYATAPVPGPNLFRVAGQPRWMC